jgi:tRNA pseudouridine13 synthase
MASVVPRPEELLEPARKRQKLSSPTHLSAHVANDIAVNSMSEAQTIAHNAMMSQRDREAQAGILCFVNESNPGFSGILKQRYVTHLIRKTRY